MSGISEVATVTLNVNGKQAEDMMTELGKKIDDTSKRIDYLKAKIKDKDALKAARESVAKYTSELESLKPRLKEAVEKYQELKDAGASKDDLKNARESVKSLKQELHDTTVRLKNAKAELADFDPKVLEKARRELKGYKSSLEQIQAATVGINNALNNLDSATPRQLEKALRTLNKQLKDLPPGSEVWQSHVEKIKELKGRLSELRGELEVQESLWDKFRNWINNSGAALVAIFLGFDQAVSTLRGYVDTYAEMEQEMANVRKYTGMTEAQVSDLNDEFKKMDTRSSREQLNMLAQEAGRLGKTSKEDILGFVRAADKVNVALDDLGKGATLTLSKLTGIFGVEEQYGTEQALLKTGSVINELSQNCSASAPYIANFTERIGGVGAQANMTIPQIMGFAAVLDANAQQVEASSTALSQIIVRLYQDPAKYARVAGLEVESFTKLMKEDANSALILFLETLQKAGGMDTLSPMFKDMGENGSSAIDALSTLATHIDMVKAQQEAANIAFAEGQSIDIEFAVQNNTVQASLDKCKNAAHELQVELGERLYPLMQHFMTSGAAVMRALLTSIRFLSEHKTTVITLTAAIGAYITVLKLEQLWINRTAIATLALDKAKKLYLATTKALPGVVAAVRLAMAALSNTFTYFRNGLEVTYGMQEKWRKSMAAMNLMGWTTLILAAASALFLYFKRIGQVSESEKMLNKIREDGARQMGEEKLKVEALIEAAQDETRSLEDRRVLITKLNAMIPGYNAQLDETTGKYIASKEALDKYIDSLTRKYEIEGAEAEWRRLGQEKSVLNTKKDEIMEKYAGVSGISDKDLDKVKLGVGPVKSGNVFKDTKREALINARDHEISKVDEQIREIEEQENRLKKLYGVGITEKYVKDTISEDEPSGSGSGDSGNGQQTTDNSNPDRFASEKAWREQQEAEARIAYAKGIDTYSEYTYKMKDIAEEYNDMLLQRDDLTSEERLKILADYWESVNALTTAGTQLQIDQENKEHQAILDNLKKSYTERLQQGNLSAEERKQADKLYQEEVELQEMDHLKELIRIYENNADEKLKAQRKLQDMELAAARRHQQEMEDLEKENRKKQEENQKRLESLPGEKRKSDIGNRMDDARQEYASKKDQLDKALKDGLISLEEYEQRLARIKRELEHDVMGALKSLGSEWASLTVQMADSWKYFIESLKDGDPFDGLQSAIGATAAVAKAVMSQLTTFVQAELQIQTSRIEARYDDEIQRAEGNSYRIAKLEKQKEAEIAKAKNEANRKMFAMQVIQAVAQTAQNAVEGFGAGLQAGFPMALWLAPALAALATAQGAVQIAAIKKQQQASEAQGYSQGGFTRPGRVDEPAGIVHAGEWVASQKLLASPVARPMIEALDYAQRTNTIGSLRTEDVSRSITAPQQLSMMADADPSAALIVSALASNAGAVSRLVKRLDEPFVTVNTVAGDHGIDQAYSEYDTLIRNKTPRSRRKSNS